MKLNHAMSLWNFFHYSYRNRKGGLPELQEVLTQLKPLGYSGVELWHYWKGQDLFKTRMARDVSEWCHGLRRSLHTEGARSFEKHKMQIDGARRCGVEVIVLHPTDLCDYVKGGNGELYRPDIALTRDVVAYASDRNITLALENGGLDFLVEAIENVEGLRITLDVGHVYLELDRKRGGMENKTMAEYLEKLGPRLAHMHIQDVLPEPERAFPDAGLDHYELGTGAIPEEDWELLFRKLKELGFRGLAVFEIRPRNPFLTGNRAILFLEGITI